MPLFLLAWILRKRMVPRLSMLFMISVIVYMISHTALSFNSKVEFNKFSDFIHMGSGNFFLSIT